MRIIDKSAFSNFYDVYPNTETALRSFYTVLLYANWKKPEDAVRTYGYENTDPIPLKLEHEKRCKNLGRLCINVRGNNLRVVLLINYKYKIAYVKFVGTHVDYDKTDAATV